MPPSRPREKANHTEINDEATTMPPSRPRVEASHASPVLTSSFVLFRTYHGCA